MDSCVCRTLVSLTLHVVAAVCLLLGFGFLSIGHVLARVGALCRDAASGAYGSPVEVGTLLDDQGEDVAPVWFYDVKEAGASITSMSVTEGRKWYAVRKDREVGIFATWETCKSHVHGYRGSEFKAFRNLNDARTYLQRKQ